jgi:acetylornithine aminotransferase
MSLQHIMPTYFNRLPIAFSHGKGTWLWDTEGKQYLDALSGIAVCSLGHAHPAITKAISEQASKLLHTSNGFRIPNQELLAEKLCEVANMEQVYFCNSGAEANEAAIKITRMFARKKNIAEPVVITMKNSFHGRTFATMCATGTERIQIGFEPLMPGFIHLPLNDIAALEQQVNSNPNIVAIMLEPTQGDGGVFSATQEYFAKIRELCDSRDLLMIADEVQTGLCRTGKWFASEHYRIQPDVITNAKALGNGVPIAVCMARGKACNLFGPGKHGTTFGGNPFVCAVGLAVINTMQQDNILSNVEKVGTHLLNQLKETFSKHPHVVDIRGRGLMLGVELDRNAMEIVAIGLKHGIILNIVANKTIRLLPPLNISLTEADEMVKRLQTTIKEFTGY